MSTPTQPPASGRSRYYNRDGEPITPVEFERLHDDLQYRVLTRHQVTTPEGEYHVLTVWLGSDQVPFSDEPRPLIFGTAATKGGGELFENREWWAATEAEALANHARLLERLRDLTQPAQ